MNEQQQIDAQRRAAAESILAEVERVGDDLRSTALNWIVTAMQHCVNEDYYRGERDRLKSEVTTLAAANGQLFAQLTAVQARCTELFNVVRAGKGADECPCCGGARTLACTCNKCLVSTPVTLHE